MRLLRTFFRVQSYNPNENSPLIFEKLTPGDFTFEVPQRYRDKYLYIEYAGAAGGRAKDYLGVVYAQAGQGAILANRVVLPNTNFTLTGTIGERPPQASVALDDIIAGGSGYDNGGDGQPTTFSPGQWLGAGGGGGSTRIVFNDVPMDIADGGSGSGYLQLSGHLAIQLYSGKGGGIYGGASIGSNGGNNATTPGMIAFQDAGGYVKVWYIKDLTEKPSDAK